MVKYVYVCTPEVSSGDKDFQYISSRVMSSYFYELPPVTLMAPTPSLYLNSENLTFPTTQKSFSVRMSIREGKSNERERERKMESALRERGFLSVGCAI